MGGVDFTIAEGEIRFLIGPNGAGKTTLIDTVTGLVKAAEGSVAFAGKEMLGLKEYEVVREGIGRTFQTPTVFERASVSSRTSTLRRRSAGRCSPCFGAGRAWTTPSLRCSTRWR